MSEPFLNSDDYDERAHQLYNEAQYDEAIDILREGLSLYPHAAELHVGMGYARLAREEYVWSRKAFEEAVALDADHERSEEHTSEPQSPCNLVCRLLLEKKKKYYHPPHTPRPSSPESW